MSESKYEIVLTIKPELRQWWVKTTKHNWGICVDMDTDIVHITGWSSRVGALNAALVLQDWMWREAYKMRHIKDGELEPLYTRLEVKKICIQHALVEDAQGCVWVPNCTENREEVE